MSPFQVTLEYMMTENIFITNNSKTGTLYVTIPQYDGSINSFMQIELIRQQKMIYQKKLPFNLIVEILNYESLITRARNTLFQSFVHSDYDVLLMLDSDIVISAYDLLSIYEKTLKYDVLQYPYRIKSHDFQLVITKFLDVNYPIAVVEQAGTGIFQLSKNVQRRIQSYQIENRLNYRQENSELEFYDVFQQRIGTIKDTTTYLSEDWFFCNLLNQLGFKIYCDLSVTTHHITKNCFFTYSPELLVETMNIKNENIDKDTESESIKLNNEHRF